MENDDELIQIFIEESKEILEKIKSSLEVWKETEGEETKEILDAILRELHTLKGSARMIGLLGLSEYTHHLEQVIQKIRQDPGSLALHRKTIKEMQSALDYLTAYMEVFATSRVPPSSVPPVVSLKNDDNHPLTLFTQKEERLPTIAQETIRVKTTLLENFRHLAGQINVSRSHLEQNVRETINITLQMSKEIKVLREQLRQLQAKTDVELQRAQDKIQEKYDEFDILEMDRYSFLQTATRSLNEKMNRIDVFNGNVIRGIRRMENALLEQKRVGNRLEEGVTHVRLISIESLVPRLKRMIQQVSEELGKEVRLECIRIEGEVDKEVLEKLISSLEHMIEMRLIMV
jgi:chemosensory pili system protein ChpA (sensor histidine kinase/response regulator)